MASPTRKFSAREILEDIQSGMTQPEMGEKYGLSPERLRRLLDQLVGKKLIDSSELDPSLPDSTGSEDNEAPEDYRPLFSGVQLDSPELKSSVASASPSPDSSVNHGPAAPREGYFLDDSQQPERDSQEKLWSLKLYGNTTRDRIGFCKSLAAVLGIDYRLAEEYYDKAPVVVKSGLTKEKAERVSAVMRSIGALCIVEEQAAAVERAKPAETSSEFAFLLPRDRSFKEEGLLPSGLKASSIVLMALVVFLSLFGWRLMKATAPVREYQSTTEAISKKQSKPRDEVAEAGLPQVFTYDDLSLDADRLETEIKQIRFQIDIERGSFNMLKKSVYSTSDHDNLLRKDLEIKGLQKKLDAKLNELRSVKKRINILSNAERPAESTE